MADRMRVTSLLGGTARTEDHSAGSQGASLGFKFFPDAVNEYTTPLAPIPCFLRGAAWLEVLAVGKLLRPGQELAGKSRCQLEVARRDSFAAGPRDEGGHDADAHAGW